MNPDVGLIRHAVQEQVFGSRYRDEVLKALERLEEELQAAESLNVELVEALELAYEWVHTYDSDDLDAVNADALIAAQGAVEDAVAKAKERSGVH